jgi:hypothetical protein
MLTFIILFLVLILLGVVGAIAILAGFFLLMTLASLIFTLDHAYPWFKKISLWAAKLENLFALIILAVIVIIILVVLTILLYLTGFRFYFFPLILMPITLFFIIPAGLGIVVWILRLIRGLFARWRGWLVNLYISMQLKRHKIPAGMGYIKEKWAPEIQAAEVVEKQEEEMIKLSWRDRLLMRIMSNRLVIRIMSQPFVIRALTRLTNIFVWITSLFKRKKKEEVVEMSTEGIGTQEEVKIGFKDKLMMKIMSNSLVIKIMSMPIVIKVITKLMNISIAITSVFKRKKKGEEQK